MFALFLLIICLIFMDSSLRRIELYWSDYHGIILRNISIKINRFPVLLRLYLWLDRGVHLFIQDFLIDFLYFGVASILQAIDDKKFVIACLYISVYFLWIYHVIHLMMTKYSVLIFYYRLIELSGLRTNFR